MTFRAFSIGFSVAVLALACGSDSSGNDSDPEVEPPRETCDDNPLLAECADQLPDQDLEGNPIERPDPPAQSGGDDPGEEPSAEDLARAAAENVLASNC